MSHPQDSLDLSFDSVVPSAIWFNQNLEPSAIKLYAMIRMLTKKHGYCFATNEYLSALMEMDISSVKRLMRPLIQEGYIEIESEKIGLQVQRHIYLSDKFKKSLRRLKNELGGAQNSAGGGSKISHINKGILNKDIEKERESIKEKEPTAPTSTFFSFKRVKMEEEKHKKLIQDFGIGKIQEMLERLDEYADINPKRFKQYADHATVIRKWLRQEPAEGLKNSAKEINEYLHSHPKKELIVEAIKKKKIEIGKDYIEFTNVRNGEGYIKFTNPKAKILIQHYLAKIGI